MKSYLKHNWTSLLLIALALGFGLYLSDQLPEKLPTHWGIDGKPDEYSSKSFGLFFFPSLTFGLTLLIYFLLNISPKGFDMKNSRRSVGKVNLAITILMVVLHVGMLLIAMSPDKYNFASFFGLGMGLFLLVTGNFMSKVEQNFFIGVRVPWTLTSERNWNATHRFAAKTMFLGGLALLGVAFVFESMPLFIGLVLVSTLMPVGYSYWYFKNKEGLAS